MSGLVSDREEGGMHKRKYEKIKKNTATRDRSNKETETSQLMIAKRRWNTNQPGRICSADKNVNFIRVNYPRVTDGRQFATCGGENWVELLVNEIDRNRISNRNRFVALEKKWNGSQFEERHRIGKSQEWMTPSKHTFL